MNLPNPSGIAIIAALSSFLAGLLGASISAWTTKTAQAAKIAADERLASKRFAFERQQEVFKRRFELAENMLTDAYRFRSAMKFVRNGVAFQDEGSTRPADTLESDAIKRSRDAYFVPAERLIKDNEFFATMFARRTTSQAHFGNEVDRAYDLFNHAIHRVRVAVSMLVSLPLEQEAADPDFMKSLRNDIWQPMAEFNQDDEVGREIEEGVQIIERLCHPVLAWVDKIEG